MQSVILFFFNSVMLGAGLAMDAFSVSLANGLREPLMRRARICGIAGIFAAFQAAMPMLGWLLVHTALTRFQALAGWIPWIAFVLLAFLGGKMLYEGAASRKNREKKETGENAEKPDAKGLALPALLVQGVATSIDAMSAGFTIASYGVLQALVCVLVIAAVTFFICLGGVLIGRRFGTALAGKASVLGGAILIAIGLEILLGGIG